MARLRLRPHRPLAETGRLFSPESGISKFERNTSKLEISTVRDSNYRQFGAFGIMYLFMMPRSAFAVENPADDRSKFGPFHTCDTSSNPELSDRSNFEVIVSSFEVFDGARNRRQSVPDRDGATSCGCLLSDFITREFPTPRQIVGAMLVSPIRSFPVMASRPIIRISNRIFRLSKGSICAGGIPSTSFFQTAQTKGASNALCLQHWALVRGRTPP